MVQSFRAIPSQATLTLCPGNEQGPHPTATLPHGQTPEEALCTHWGNVPERCEAREHARLLN